MSAKKKKPQVEPLAGVIFDDLEPEMCRWILNDESPFRFCGATKLAGKSYCSTHHPRSVATGHKYHTPLVPHRLLRAAA
jgi:hypothetical protein